ncbi:MAG: hypothetical protein IKL10_06795 [Clostridia bacterium]|nr:hypothetical protein [Clostridia bacterium]
MTVKEAIEKTDILYPNVFSFSQKALWLQELDGKVFAEFLSNYKDSIENFSGGYTLSPEKELLIPDLFSEIYQRYLIMQFDIRDSDITRYTNSASLFNTAYLSFMNYYNRTHTVKENSINID